MVEGSTPTKSLVTYNMQVVNFPSSSNMITSIDNWFPARRMEGGKSSQREAINGKQLQLDMMPCNDTASDRETMLRWPALVSYVGGTAVFADNNTDWVRVIASNNSSWWNLEIDS